MVIAQPIKKSGKTLKDLIKNLFKNLKVSSVLESYK